MSVATKLSVKDILSINTLSQKKIKILYDIFSCFELKLYICNRQFKIRNETDV